MSRRVLARILVCATSIVLIGGTVALSGCDGATDTEVIAPAEEGATPGGESGSQVPPTDATAVPDRPTVEEAEAAILEIAREEYAEIPALTATVVGTGQDSQGRWWFQAWTDHGPEYEGEQWFVIYEADEWTLHDYGTGMERSDYPSDIAWEDIP